MEVEEEKMDANPCAGDPGYSSHISPEAAPAPALPSFSAQVPSAPQPSVQHLEAESSCGRNCAQAQAPVAARTQDNELRSNQLHGQCSQGGYHQMESKEVLKTRLAPGGAAEARRKPVGGGDMGTSETINGKCERAPADGVMGSDIPT